MNSANLIGNLTRDPDLKYSSSGMALMNCNIAVKRQFKDKQSGEYESDFINIKAFGKTAELFGDSFRKGSKLGITGSIQTGRYENQSGQTVYTTDVIVNSITFVEPKNDNAPATNTGMNTPGSSVDINPNDLPF